MKLLKIKSNKKIAIGTIILFFFSFIFYFTLQTSAQNISVLPTKKSAVVSTQVVKVAPGLPVRIKIPKIKVNALVEHVGLTLDGAVDSPLGPKNAAWFNEGPVPGDKGNAIFDGHSGWKNKIPAVFDNLKKLKKGDKIYVTSNTGVTTTFIVNKLKVYDRNDAALDVFSSTDDGSHLNLITCSGTWNSVEKGRNSRIVVFADKQIL